MATIKDLFETPSEIKKRELALYRTLTGYNLAKEVSATKPNLVLDLGCGANSFKSIIPNLIGIDVADVGDVDIVTDIKSLPDIFAPNCADWIFCFGPLNFGDEDWIDEICSVFKYLLRPEGIIVSAIKQEHSNAPLLGKAMVKLRDKVSPDRISWSNEYINILGFKHGFASTEYNVGHIDISSMTDDHLQLFKTLMEEDGKNKKQTIEILTLREKHLEHSRYIWRWKHK